MSSNPDQIRHEIESTRAELSGDVNALADSVRPSTVARRQVDKVREGVSGMKDSVMGTADDAGQSVSGAAGDATSAVRRKTRGNPLAAGLVAFAAGWLVSSLLPASQAERQGATALKEKARPLADDLQATARQVAENLKEPAREAVEQVKASAGDSAATVKDEASTTAAGVKDSTRQATEEVRRQS
jgi:cell division septum initiation protein DivIVA